MRQPETSTRGTEPWATPPPRLGSYLLKREIARDPLEVTFLARDASRGERSVLVRLLCRQLDDEAFEELTDLVEAIGELRHPHLGALLTVGREPDGMVYVVGERPPGRSLSRLLDGELEELSAEHVVAWADDLAAAVDHLHDNGLMHGSIGPEYVVVSPGGEACLVAPGFAGLFRQLGAEAHERQMLLGDHGDAPLAPPDDIAALAATVWLALGGHPVESYPGPGRWPRNPEPISGRSVQINLGLLAAMSPDPAIRPARGRDLIQALHGAPLPVTGSHIGPPARPKRPLNLNLIAAGMAITLIVWGAWLWYGRDPSEPRVGPIDGPIAFLDEVPDPLPETETAPAIVKPIEPPVERLAAVEAGEIATASPPLADPDRRAGSLPAATQWPREEPRTTDWPLHREPMVAAELFAMEERLAPIRAQSLLLGHRHNPEIAQALSVARGHLELAEEHVAAGRDRAAMATYQAALDSFEKAIASHRALGIITRAVLKVRDRFAEAISLARAMPAPPRLGRTRAARAGVELVYLEPGVYTMGSPDGELGRDVGEIEREVRITRAFWIGRREVTRAEFAAFVLATEYETDAEIEGWALSLATDGRWRQVQGLTWRDPGFVQTDAHPVVCVSLRDAQAFCRWLGDADSRAYRLPTEAEWEYACRAGTQTAWHWGNDPPAETPPGNLADVHFRLRFSDGEGFTFADGFVFTCSAGSFAPNIWGIFDMHGNAQEWCGDRYAPYDLTALVDPIVDTGDWGDTGSRTPYILRGGSFASTPASSRSAHRDGSPAATGFSTVGFRVVMEEPTTRQ